MADGGEAVDGDVFAPLALAAGRVACGVLGWRPGEFWDATPAELLMVLGSPEAAAPPLSSAELGELMRDDR